MDKQTAANNAAAAFSGCRGAAGKRLAAAGACFHRGYGPGDERGDRFCLAGCRICGRRQTRSILPAMTSRTRRRRRQGSLTPSPAKRICCAAAVTVMAAVLCRSGTRNCSTARRTAEPCPMIRARRPLKAARRAASCPIPLCAGGSRRQCLGGAGQGRPGSLFEPADAAAGVAGRQRGVLRRIRALAGGFRRFLPQAVVNGQYWPYMLDIRFTTTDGSRWYRDLGPDDPAASDAVLSGDRRPGAGRVSGDPFSGGVICLTEGQPVFGPCYSYVLQGGDGIWREVTCMDEAGWQTLWAEQNFSAEKYLDILYWYDRRRSKRGHTALPPPFGRVPRLGGPGGPAGADGRGGRWRAGAGGTALTARRASEGPVSLTIYRIQNDRRRPGGAGRSGTGQKRLSWGRDPRESLRVSRTRHAAKGATAAHGFA